MYLIIIQLQFTELATALLFTNTQNAVRLLATQKQILYLGWRVIISCTLYTRRIVRQ